MSHGKSPILPRPQILLQRRYVQTGGQFKPLRPPSPSSLGAPRPPRDFKHTRKWLRRILILTGIAGGFYFVDRQACAFGISRSLRTFGNGLFVAFDYKLNFRAEPLTGGTVGDLHRRSAERFFKVLHENGGLYLKIGQAIAMQSAVLPPEFQKMFARMFDDAPQDEWKDIEKVIRKDYGKSAEEVFGVSFTGEEGKGLMERTARASASVAQVHWARLPDGREVAIKIQKPEIAKQVGWDLWAFKAVMRVYTWWFDLPLYSIVPFITERLLLETDFECEAQNSKTMRKLVESEPTLKGRVYIPTVYPEFTTKRILVTEWIEGVRLWDKDAMTKRWIGGHGRGSVGIHGEKLPSPDMNFVRQQLRQNPKLDKLKPERETWKGANGKAGLGLSRKDVMTTIVDLFSAQIFKWGVVHCDPHPGNIFIRRLPSGKPEVVLIDHGLYVYMSSKFRHQYSLFWKSLMTFDNETISEITADWGIKAPDLFASATLMRPYEGGDGQTRKEFLREMQGKTPAERHFESQERMKQGLRDVLADEDKWPKELIFIGRNMRIVQGNNQFMGSPVNRLKLMGTWASRSLFQDPGLPWKERLVYAWRHLLFKGVLFVTDVAFYTFKVRQWLGWGGGMEDEVELRMKEVAKDYGVELQHDVFDG
ncbi:ABC1 family-domain-containing protein [Pseudomassariella vexata]|uniref:ABC1 family-domain-containing protein n=1 Tax=Pseudomassariella vexata TaxID=1141098 RepID=A0A1Y2E8U4_9PEZI|nr:ABC1 family-domain-containing protein [Pseudomassariella vexata]ORY67706.1 ABC1 family-domain-containing protein [Pseudomassariella vexata]